MIENMTREEKINYIIDGLEKLGMASPEGLQKLMAMKDLAFAKENPRPNDEHSDGE